MRAEVIGRFVGAMSDQYRSQRSYYERDQQEYEQKLRSDVVGEAIFNDQSPDHSTIDSCVKFSFRACAVINRHHRCGYFESPTQRAKEESRAKFLAMLE